MRLVASAAGRCMAGTQAEPATSSGASSSSGSSRSSSSRGSRSSSSGGSRSSTASSRRGSNSSGHSGGGSRPAAAQGDSNTAAAQPNATWADALLGLSRMLPLLLELSHACLFNCTNKGFTAARHNPLVGMEQYGIISNPEYADGNWDRLNSEEQASLSVLCSALQDTLPQLASLAETALRKCSARDQKDLLDQASCSGRCLRLVSMPGLLVAAGLQRPSSPALKPLCGLAYSVLKAGSLIQVQHVGVTAAALATYCLGSVLGCTSVLLQAVCASSSSGGSSSGSSSADPALTALENSKMCHQVMTWTPEALTTIKNSTASSSSSSSTDAVLVPWLVCLGRGCLGYATQLQLNPSAVSPAAGARSHKQRIEDMGQAFLEVSTVLPGWLQSSSVSAQLSAAGYDTQPLVQLLQSVASAQQHAAQAGAPALAQLLVRLGLALSSLPVSSTCNNPLCTTLTGLTEQQLVVGSSRRCAACRVARYCCKACQLAHWKQHKPACKAQVAAAAAAKADDAAEA